MSVEAYLGQFSLLLNGSLASKKVLDNLLECTVENTLHLPDACTFRLYDVDFEFLDDSSLAEGASLEVQAGKDDNPLTTIFQGEVVGLELDLAAQGVPTTTILAYDKTHRLHRGRNAQTFTNMTDADIVQKVGAQAGFRVDADSTPQVYDWIAQHNQTNWEFLTSRAKRNGYRLYVKGDNQLCFKKVSDDGDTTVTLNWGEELRSFRPRTSATHQVDKVVVRGWDPGGKQAIIGQAMSANGLPRIGQPKTGADIASGAFGPASMVVVHKPVHNQSEADDLAQSILDGIGGSFLEAEGLCYGRPDIKPGVVVEVPNIGNRFSGKYYVTSTTHTYSPAEGYTTQFSVTGKRSSSVLAHIGGATGWGSGGDR